MARDVTGGDTWYVAFRQPSEVPGVYVRNSVAFRTETEAKRFAAERLAEGCDVTAGTILIVRKGRSVCRKFQLGSKLATDVVTVSPDE